MKNLFISFLLFLSFTSTIIPQNEETVNQIIKSSLIDSKGYSWLKELCEIGPRLSGSQNSIKAIKWAESKMKNLGFDSFGCNLFMFLIGKEANWRKLLLVLPKNLLIKH